MPIEKAPKSSHPRYMQVEPWRHSLPSHRALLLNASYEPMRIVCWQKGLILWFQGKVEVLEFHSVFARSVRTSFQLPSVLRLKEYVRPRSLSVVRFCRENVYLRDDYTCQYCRIQFPEKFLTLDHVVPASKQGPKTWNNVVTACQKCNQRKGNRTPHGAGMPLMKQPETPQWLPNSEFEFKNQQFPAVWLNYLRFQVG